MSGVRWATVARAFRRMALPLGSYYAVTLALPLANGAASSGAFMEHAVVVLVVPVIAIILGSAVHAIAHALARLGKTNERDPAAYFGNSVAAGVEGEVGYVPSSSPV
jgi:hypothetical protein